MDGGARDESSLGKRHIVRVSRHWQGRDEAIQPDTNQHQCNAMAESYRNRSGSSPSDPHYNNGHRARRPRLELSTRYIGDGLDHRRPAMSSSAIRADSPLFVGPNEQLDEQQNELPEPETIDLTREVLVLPRGSARGLPLSPPTANEPPRRPIPLPRFSRHDIIDISSGDEEEDGDQDVFQITISNRQSEHDGEGHNSSSTSQTQQSGSSPSFDWSDLNDDMNDFMELQSSLPTRSMPRRRQQNMLGNDNVVDLTDDDVEFIESRSVPRSIEPTLSTGVQTLQTEPETEQRRFLPFSVGHIADIFRATSGRTSRLGERLAAHYNAAEEARQAAYGSRYPDRQFNGRLTAALNAMQGGLSNYLPSCIIEAGAQVPDIMDYQTAAFDLGSPHTRRSREPPYQAPAPPAEGFTRSPTANEVVICPNCGDELAQGEDELKRQVWVVKACGHAYCGTCVDARLRQLKSRGKQDNGMQNSLPLLKKCAVDGCGKPVSKATVLHVYLSE